MAVAPLERQPLDPALLARERRVRRRWRVGALCLATVLLVAPVGFTVAQLTDPYRPGAEHRVEVPVSGCDRPGSLHLGDRTWVSHDHLPPTWPTGGNGAGGAVAVDGTFAVTGPDAATFTADAGGTVTYRRLAPRAFGDLSCTLR